MVSISAIILTRGKKDLTILKKSLDFCQEILVYESEITNFALTRNKSFKNAKGDWLFFIDDDEEVSIDLRSEIEIVINKKEFTAYAIPRKNIIFGKEFKHSGQFPDYQKRLFLRSKFSGWRGQIHEEAIFEGKLGFLKSSIIHNKHDNLSDMVNKTNEWSEIEARLMFDVGHPKMNVFRFFSAGIREFWLRMIIQMAFLDGVKGVIYALYQVFSKLISYSKLWEMQLK